MSANYEPNPPTRKPGGFPKTTTFPEGWVMDELMEYYNGAETTTQDAVTGQPVLDPAEAVPVPATGRTNGKTHHKTEREASASEAAGEESPFTRKLEPFPSSVDLRGSWL